MSKEDYVRFEAFLEDVTSRHKGNLTPEELAQIYLVGRTYNREPQHLPVTDEERAQLEKFFSPIAREICTEIKKRLE